MFERKIRRRSLKSLQSQSETRRHAGILGRLLADNGPDFTTCQWLYGEPKKRDFCAEPCKDESSYCAYHHSVCYTRAPK